MKKAALVLATATILSSVHAALAAQEPATLGLDDLTEADRAEMVRGASNYQSCIRTRLRELAPDHTDMRALIDDASIGCEEALDNLGEYLAGRGFAGDFVEGYLQMSRSRSMRKLIPEAVAAVAGTP